MLRQPQYMGNVNVIFLSAQYRSTEARAIITNFKFMGADRFTSLETESLRIKKIKIYDFWIFFYYFTSRVACFTLTLKYWFFMMKILSDTSLFD